jgi:hypothetical protein
VYLVVLLLGVGLVGDVWAVVGHQLLPAQRELLWVVEAGNTAAYSVQYLQGVVLEAAALLQHTHTQQDMSKQF